MSTFAARRFLARLLLGLILALRQFVLDRPKIRGALRAIGRPFIRLAMRWNRPQPEPAPTPLLGDEPVLRLPLDYTPGALSPAPRMAILLHVADEAAAAPIVQAVQRLQLPADLLITYGEGVTREGVAALLADGRTGRHELRPSARAGGVAGQVGAYPEVVEDYDLVLVLRAAADASAAQSELALKSLLGGRPMVRGLLEAFLQAPQLGLVAPRTADVVRAGMIWGEAYTDCRSLAEQLGFAIYPDSPLDFAAGGMFWARTGALRPWLAVSDSAAPSDAVDRLVFHACELAGLRWARAGSDAGAAPPETFYRVEIPRILDRTVTDCARTVLTPGRRPQPAPRYVRADEDPKAAFRAVCRGELDEFLASGERIALPTSETPDVTIILLLFNQAELTYQCLRSLCFALDAPCEVIIADNASSDRTHELLDRIDGARIVRNGENLHFLRGVNAAAGLARGRHLLLLNNDTRLTPGSIAAAVGRLDAEPDLGAVGGRIELLDGTLQEAGSIIWRDGSCLGYGRGRDPAAPEFQFRRDVDYCSGAFLMVRRDLFESLGRLDEAFAPAYYEETDLCMRIRERGLRVGYDPRIHVAHFEFGSAATSEAALALQAKHQQVFVARHAQALGRGHQPPGESSLRARMRSDAPGRVLILEDQVPYPHLGSGYPRALDILQAVTRAGWFATLFPMSYPDVDFATAHQVLPPEVEIAAERGRLQLAEFLAERAGYYDAVIVSRPHNMEFFRAALAEAPQFIALENVVYDAEAIFALREAARDRLQAGTATASDEEVAREVGLAEGAGAVFAVNEAEAANFRARGVPRVEVIGHALEAEPTAASFAARRDLLFVGALDAEGSPNADSLVFFVREVMPRLDALIGDDYVLRVVGRPGAAQVRALASDRVQLLGRVEALAPLYDQSRVFVAPTRFAAGIPMKVQAAAAAGLPTAITPLLAEQLGWSDGVEAAVGESAEAFAQACARLYQDPALWGRARDGALARIEAECRPDAFSARIAAALQAVRRPQAASSSSSLRMSVTAEATPPSMRMTLLQ